MDNRNLIITTMASVNLNSSTLKDLMRIKHIGNVRAQKIIKRRPFKDRFELSNVGGLGEKRMSEIFKQNIIEV